MAGSLSSTSIFLLICGSIWIVINAQEYDCPPTWSSFNNSCFYLNHDARVHWETAMEECERRGSDLTSIHSVEERNFLAELVVLHEQEEPSSARYTIGLHDRDKEGEFKWTDGTQVDYKVWYKGEPNNDEIGEDCVVLLQPVYKYWNDVSCNSINAYICKTKSELNDRACEKSTLNITCRNGYIQITYANYGRLDRNTCGWNSGWNDNCAANQSLLIVDEMCTGETTCEIEASNDIFGDPCNGTSKYLEVRYSCEKAGNGGNESESRNTPSQGVNLGIPLGIVVVVIVISIVIATIYFRRKSSTDRRDGNNLSDLKTPTTTNLSNVVQDQVPDNQNISYPDNPTGSETYIGLDQASRQPEAVYQGITNPEEFKSTDDYLSLDVKSLSKTGAEYQSLNDNTALDNKKTDQDQIYQEISENNTDQYDYAYANPTTTSIPPVNSNKNAREFYVNAHVRKS